MSEALEATMEADRIMQDFVEQEAEEDGLVPSEQDQNIDTPPEIALAFSSVSNQNYRNTL